jgi:hypothetical protein
MNPMNPTSAEITAITRTMSFTKEVNINFGEYLPYVEKSYIIFDPKNPFKIGPHEYTKLDKLTKLYYFWRVYYSGKNTNPIPCNFDANTMQDIDDISKECEIIINTPDGKLMAEFWNQLITTTKTDLPFVGFIMIELSTGRMRMIVKDTKLNSIMVYFLEIAKQTFNHLFTKDKILILNNF